MQQITRLCPVCGKGQETSYLTKADLRLVRCRACSMVYVNPVPTEFASGEYYDQTGGDYYLSPAKLESDYAEVRFERELRLFRQHCPKGSVLDVGCSSGAFLFQLGKRFGSDYDLLGTDASGPALAYAESRGVPVVRGDFPKRDFAGKQFDAITFWAVLEHLHNPKAFVERAWSLLRPGGLCFVLVPNLQSLALRILGARYRYVYPQHLNYFSKHTLLQLVDQRFTVIDFHSTHFNPIIIWQDWRRAGAEVPNTDRAALLKRTTAYKQSPWLKPVKTAYQITEKLLGSLRLADNLAAVLRKK
ncbi:MAG TPA: class I SAM-dependent methyltransferase [Clostridia bacterium]|nr:class I SAM-dependent methyltransferase [Clostridia bacterium]